MENYIGLEKLRLNNIFPIELKVEGNPENISIVPLVFIVFLENAFKHGVSDNQEDSWVKAMITVEGNQIHYVVENSKLKKAAEHANGKSGIGLQNVRRRLDLSYPGRYKLLVEEGETQYRVDLTLDLA